MSETAVVPFEGTQHDLAVYRPPKIVLEEAQRAAKALKEVLDNKPRKVVFNNEQYLEFEDWQTVGRFYGVTARVLSSVLIDIDGVKGFEARAEAIRADGVIVSSADAMCLKDEPNWKSKPMFQLRSMAQTRACSKALRNVLSWVVVLAGYKPTPAEEMEGVYEPPRASVVQPAAVPPPTQAAAPGVDAKQPPVAPKHMPITDKEGWGENDYRTYLDMLLAKISDISKRTPAVVLRSLTFGKDGRFATEDPSTLRWAAKTNAGKDWSPLKVTVSKAETELETVETDIPV